VWRVGEGARYWNGERIYDYLHNNYRFVRLVGFGSFGVVAEVLHLASRKSRALKMVFNTDAEEEAMVRQELEPLIAISNYGNTYPNDTCTRHLTHLFEFMKVKWCGRGFGVEVGSMTR